MSKRLSEKTLCVVWAAADVINGKISAMLKCESHAERRSEICQAILSAAESHLVSMEQEIVELRGELARSRALSDRVSSDKPLRLRIELDDRLQGSRVLCAETGRSMLVRRIEVKQSTDNGSHVLIEFPSSGHVFAGVEK